MRACLFLAVLLGLSAAAAAQSAGTGAGVRAGPDPAEARRDQKIERFRHEDAGSRIDEVRVGGQTESITVQPKMEGLPAYEVQPGSLHKGRPLDPREGLAPAGGQRSWNVLRF